MKIQTNNDMASLPDERAAFEAWCKQADYDTSPDHEDKELYWYADTSAAWEAWQARSFNRQAAALAAAQAVVPYVVMLPSVSAHEIHGMLQEATKLLDSMPESISEQLQVRHFFRDELEGGMLLMKDALTAPAQPAAREVVPAGLKVDRGFRWDGGKQQHVPTLLIEFEPVPANSPNDSPGWKARDAVADMLAAQEGK